MSDSFETMWNEYQPVVAGIAHEYGRKAHQWGGSAADFRQELAAWAFTQHKWLDRKQDELGDDFDRFLAKCLRNECVDYLLDMRAAAGGQDRATAYWYTKAELEHLLGAMFTPEAWQDPPAVEGGERRGNSTPGTGGNWIATLADVSRAFDGLRSGDKMLLREHYEDGWRNKDLAVIYGLSEAAMSAKRGRALERMLKTLGGPRPEHMRKHEADDPWRGRHAVSNAQARARLEQAW